MPPLDKPRRIVDPKAVKAAKLPYCERCGCYAGPGVEMEAHHIKSRGAGGDDVAENLISLCLGWRSNWCHKLAHSGRIPKEELLAIVAARDTQ